MDQYGLSRTDVTESLMGFNLNSKDDYFNIPTDVKSEWTRQ